MAQQAIEQTLPQSTTRELTPTRRQGKRLQLAIVALVILSAVGYLVYSGLNTKVYYHTVSELQAGKPALTGQQVRVAGIVTEDAIVREQSGAIIRFTMADDGGAMPVLFKGAVPDIFQPGIEVVVEGKYGADGLFVADTLLAKCPSKFDTAQGGGQSDGSAIGQ